MMQNQAVVIRDAKKTTKDSTNLLPGDIVLLKSGSKVPVDLRLIETKDLKALLLYVQIKRMTI